MVGVLCCERAFANDLGADVSFNTFAPTVTYPRSGAASVSLSGSYDFTDRWTGFLTATYLRDFATKTTESSSPGSNVFLFNAGAMFLATEHWLFMASLSGSPPSEQRNATTITFADTSADVVLRAVNASLGGSLVASYASNGLSNWEHTVDLSAGVTHFDGTQQAELGTSLRARIYRTFCERNPDQGYCPLVIGLASPLTQARIGVTYTATIASKTDASIDVAGFIYDNPDPLSVGVLLVRQGPEIGLGVPVAPWRLTLRPSVLHRFGKVSVRLAYQLGLYVQQAGSNQLLSLKLAWKVSDSFRLTLTVIGQSDWVQRSLVNRGGTVTLGALVLFK